ncbi:MAG: VWA domain-containing protein [Myxococcales bacterium]|nr:VWA domain-containing protein [Myxococcales bacterium]
MFVAFFLDLRRAGLPVSLTEYLTLLEALKQRVCDPSIENFYFLSRAALVKDERHIDKFDRVFGHAFRGLAAVEDPYAEIPEEWLRKLAEKFLSPEEMARVQALGGFDALMQRLRDLLQEQKERHQGGNRFIGTAGTSPFGAYGYNPEGIRIGQDQSRHRKAVKVWDRREFRNLDDDVEVGVRNIQVALRRLRKFARQGAASELDLPGTISATARNAGYLDLQLVPERHNTVKVLLLLDIGGSMDDHVRACAELFTACRSEFKHLESFYFHNCIYESLWRDNTRRFKDRTPTLDVLRTYPTDYKLIFVGDAAMSPYELIQRGGSVEHWNEEPGAVWLQRVLSVYPHAVWLNPLQESVWLHYDSIQMVHKLVGGRMFPLTLAGLDAAIRELNH